MCEDKHETPMATPMSSYRIPIATECPWPRSRQAATLRCSHSTVTQLIESGTLGERSSPRLEKTIRPVTNFRARLGTAFNAKADKISRRKKALNRKGRVKSPQGSTASALVQTAAEGMRLRSIVYWVGNDIHIESLRPTTQIQGARGGCRLSWPVCVPHGL